MLPFLSLSQGLHTTTHYSGKPSFRKSFTGPARSIILAQSLVIGLLSFWFYQEYLNNMYLRVYIDQLFQTTGWAFVLLGVMGTLGIIAITVSRHKHAQRVEPEEVEAVPTEVQVPILTERTPAPTPTTDLSPIVAQLKAELARTTAPVEDVSASKPEETRVPVAVVKAPQSPSPVPAPRPAPLTQTPTTVIVGLVPAPQKKDGKETRVEEKAESGEKSESKS